MSLKLVCSNCKKDIGTRECNAEGISHGLCVPCIIELYSDDFSQEEIVEICRKTEIQEAKYA